MEIKTKYSIGQTVFVVKDQKIAQEEISDIHIKSTTDGGCWIEYWFIASRADENVCFDDLNSAKEYAINSIRKSCERKVKEIEEYAPKENT